MAKQQSRKIGESNTAAEARLIRALMRGLRGQTMAVRELEKVLKMRGKGKRK